MKIILLLLLAIPFAAHSDGEHFLPSSQNWRVRAPLTRSIIPSDIEILTRLFPPGRLVDPGRYYAFVVPDSPPPEGGLIQITYTQDGQDHTPQVVWIHQPDRGTSRVGEARIMILGQNILVLGDSVSGAQYFLGWVSPDGSVKMEYPTDATFVHRTGIFGNSWYEIHGRSIRDHRPESLHIFVNRIARRAVVDALLSSARSLDQERDFVNLLRRVDNRTARLCANGWEPLKALVAGLRGSSPSNLHDLVDNMIKTLLFEESRLYPRPPAAYPTELVQAFFYSNGSFHVGEGACWRILSL